MSVFTGLFPSDALKNVKETLANDNATTQELQEAYDLLREALTHKWGEWTVVTEPTCEEDGLKTRTCQCGEKTQEEIIPALGHDFDAVVTEPTCMAGGYTTHTCANCGHSYITDPVQPTGHSYVLTGVKEAGCGVGGYTGDVVCEICGDVKSTGEVIPAFCLSEAFEDLDTNRWYHEGVDFILETGLMVGMDETHFAPEGTLTRGQLVTILYRLTGSPEIENETPFTDVAANRFYAKAVAWAYEYEIVMGVTGATFEPNASATREQLVTFLARFAKLQGDKAARLNPKAEATRAQIAAILLRYCQAFGE